MDKSRLVLIILILAVSYIVKANDVDDKPLNSNEKSLENDSDVDSAGSKESSASLENDKSDESNITSDEVSGCKDANGTVIKSCAKNSLQQQIMENKDMLKRTFIVLLGLTVLVVIYFVVRTAR